MGSFLHMLHLPDPLHPFAVHFPVAFLLTGCVLAVVSLLFPHRFVLWHLVAFFLLGALGAVWAYRTGMEAAMEVRSVAAPVIPAIQEHKNVSTLMLWVAWLTVATSLTALFGAKIRGVSLAARLLTVGAAVLLLWTLQAVLHSGSLLTHTFFFGPNAPKPPPGTEEVVRLKIE